MHQSAGAACFDKWHKVLIRWLNLHVFTRLNAGKYNNRNYEHNP